MIHHVFANRSNIGDWLSARGIQSLLNQFEVEEHLCDEPFVGVTLSRLAKAGRDDLIVIGGGGLFMDYFEPFWRGLRDIAGRVPFCIWGVGFCDLKLEASLPARTLLETIVAQSSLCVVRDELTRRHLERCELPTPVACPSVAVLRKPQQDGFGFLHVNNHSTAGETAYEAMCDAGRDFAARTGRSYHETNNHIKAGNERAMQAALDLYAGSDVILSSGLHGCIIGLAMGRKVLAVSGDYKIEAFMKAAGLSEWVCDITEVGTVGERLASLSEQTPRREFLSRARVQNQFVAERVSAIYRSLPGQVNYEKTSLKQAQPVSF